MSMHSSANYQDLKLSNLVPKNQMRTIFGRKIFQYIKLIDLGVYFFSEKATIQSCLITPHASIQSRSYQELSHLQRSSFMIVKLLLIGLIATSISITAKAQEFVDQHTALRSANKYLITSVNCKIPTNIKTGRWINTISEDGKEVKTTGIEFTTSCELYNSDSEITDPPPLTGTGEVTGVLLSWEHPTKREDGSDLPASQIAKYKIFDITNKPDIKVMAEVPYPTKEVKIPLESGEYNFSIQTILTTEVPSESRYGKLSDPVSIKVP